MNFVWDCSCSRPSGWCRTVDSSRSLSLLSMERKSKKRERKRGKQRDRGGRGQDGLSWWDAGRDGVREHYKEGDSGCEERKSKKKREEEGESREIEGGGVRKGVSWWDAGRDGVREHYKEGDSGCEERKRKKKGSKSKRVSIKVKDVQEEERERNGGLMDRVTFFFNVNDKFLGFLSVRLQQL